jgi:hypothetical protein
MLFPRLEHFHQSCSDDPKSADSGLFGFWLRFGSVTGFFKPAPSPKPRQKLKILAAHRYIFSVNALGNRKRQGMNGSGSGEEIIPLPNIPVP